MTESDRAGRMSRTSSPQVQSHHRPDEQEMVSAEGGRRGDLAGGQEEPVFEESDTRLAFSGVHHDRLAENRYKVTSDLSLLCKGHQTRVLKAGEKRGGVEGK